METTKNPEKINRMTDSTLVQKAGKSWQEWFTILNTAHAHQLSHQQIAKYLCHQHQLNRWWPQIITVGYEQCHGKREPYQKPEGYEISVSKTIHTSLTMLYHAWANEKIRKTWLPESITIRKATANKSMRITWIDEVTNLNLNVDFYSKGELKSQVVIQHSKISNAEFAEKTKLFWRNELNKLSEVLVSCKKLI
jgi:CRISPR/Cas system endoribonuclease Cas6 (RAMP superfamily)